MAGSESSRRNDYLPTIWAAGAVVYRLKGSKVELLLAHRPRYDDWSIPKGKVDRGESFEKSAVREVREEVGVTGIVEANLGTVGYITPAGNRKAVRYWLIRAKDEEFLPNAEVDKVRWLKSKKALDRVTYRRDAALLNAALQWIRRKNPGMVYLVRHAHAGNKARWKASDVVRPISDRGREEVEAIVARLVRTPINYIVSSPMLRCEQSVRPLADRLGLVVTTSKRLKREATPEDLARLVKKSIGRRAVFCSHGEAIGPYIQQLAADRNVDVKGGQEWSKGSIWQLTTRRGRVTKARFVPPA